MKYLFSILIFIISSLAQSELAFKPKAEIFPDSQNWYLTLSARMAPGFDFQGDFYADLTKVEQYNGNYFVPYFIWSNQSQSDKTKYSWYVHQGIYKWLWLKFDCSYNNMETVAFNSQTTEFIKQFNVSYNASAAIPSYSICGLESPKGKLYFAFAELSPFDYFGWVPETVKKSPENPSVINVDLFTFSFKEKGRATINSNTPAKVHCADKTLFWKGRIINPNAASNLFLKNTEMNYDSNYMFFINRSCELAGLESKIKSPQPEIKHSEDLGAAKQKCKALGFKDKTEKFGTCVLELTK